MGTRADFYVGKDQQAEWIGSIAWDGYRSGIDDAILNARTEPEFRAAVSAFFADDRDDVSTPETGWPWPWKTSATSDCSYWFFDNRVWDAGGQYESYVYTPCDEEEPERETPEYDAWLANRDSIKYPDMTALKNPTLGKRSGLIVFQSRE